MSARRRPTVHVPIRFPPTGSRRPSGQLFSPTKVKVPDRPASRRISRLHRERGTTTIAASLVRRGSNRLTQNTLAPSPRIVEGRPQGRCPNGCRRNSNHQGSSFFLFFTPLRWLIFSRWGPDAVSCSQTISSSSGRRRSFPDSATNTDVLTRSRTFGVSLDSKKKKSGSRRLTFATVENAGIVLQLPFEYFAPTCETTPGFCFHWPRGTDVIHSGGPDWTHGHSRRNAMWCLF